MPRPGPSAGRPGVAARWTFGGLGPSVWAVSGLPSPIFLPQATVEAWLDANRAELGDQIITFQDRPGAYRIEPAVRFRKAIPEGPSRLLERVLTESQVTELGGELLGDSVLFGDVGFEVEGGFVGIWSEGLF